MIPINYLRLAAYGVIILIVGLLEYKVYSAGEANVQAKWDEAKLTQVQAVIEYNAKQSEKLATATNTINSQKVASDKQLKLLDDYGTSLGDAQNELKNAYSKLSIYRDANGLLWKQNTANSTSADKTTTVPIGTSSTEQVTDTATTRRVSPLEIACARETVYYNKCIGHLQTIYEQLGQPFYYEQP